MKALHLWVLPAAGMDTVPAVRDQLREFLREHPDLKVEVSVRTPGNLWARLFGLLKRPRDESRPHVVELPGHWTPTLSQLGLLEDLTEQDPALALEPWIEPLRPYCRGTAEPAEPAGARPAAVYSLPWWMEVSILYYRPDLLKRAGVPADALGSWSSLREACRQLAKRLPSAVVPIANGNPRESVSLADVAPGVWSRGGDFFSRDGSRALFHREEAYHGIHGYLELIEKGWMPLLGKSGLVPRGIFDGGAALQFSGRLARAPERGTPALSAVPSPRGERAQAGVFLSNHLALIRNAGLGAEASALLRHLAKPAQSARYAAALGALPPGAAELEASLAAARGLEEPLRAAIAAARPLPCLGALGTLERLFGRAMETLIRAILRRSYDAELLRQELIYAAAEMDYVLSMSPVGAAR